MKIKSLLILAFLTFGSIFSQKIKSPSEFLGYEIGSRFTRHHKVVDYFKYISETVSNVQLEKYGETNEHRPLYLSYISSQENINNLEKIRKANLAQTGIIDGISNNKIAIVWLSYNVHGNEASSTEASMLTIYNLLTTKKDWLENTNFKTVLMTNTPTDEKGLKYLNKNSHWDGVIFDLKHKDVMKTLSKSMTYFSTCPMEAWGITALEALSHGVPLILNSKNGSHASTDLCSSDSYYKLVSKDIQLAMAIDSFENIEISRFIIVCS